MIRAGIVVHVFLLGCPSEPARDAAPRARAADAGTKTPADPPGRAIAKNDCLACHSEDLLRQQRLTQKQWTKTVEKMQRWGAPTEPEKVAALTDYLVATYSLQAGPFALGEAAEDFEAAVAPLPDGGFAGGNAERGRALYAERCRNCHGEDGRGGPMGVNVVDRWILDRAPDFARVVREGRARMPGFEASDAEIGHLLAYTRALR